MTLTFDTSLAVNYSSPSQKIRVMSETWLAENMYCPRCGNPHLQKLDNNSPVADAQCGFCGEIFELKSKEGNVGRKISDGAYETMIERITSLTNPDLFVLNYSPDYTVTRLTLVPKFFFVPAIIERRRPLNDTARRSGWTGCNIIYKDIPEQGKIEIIADDRVRAADDVVESYRRISRIASDNIESRGWLFDVLSCVNDIPGNEFDLADVYGYADVLKDRHVNNNNIEAKIRQQLQFLRDKGFIEFISRGHYRKIS